MEGLILNTILGSFEYMAKSNSPLAIIISAIFLIMGAFFFFRKTNIQEVTSVGIIQHQQIESLLAQVELLSTELGKARKQLSEIHEQNLLLMQQVRDSNKRIQELEDILSKKGS